jgi:hypothetical protein
VAELLVASLFILGLLVTEFCFSLTTLPGTTGLSVFAFHNGTPCLKEAPVE